MSSEYYINKYRKYKYKYLKEKGQSGGKSLETDPDVADLDVIDNPEDFPEDYKNVFEKEEEKDHEDELDKPIQHIKNQYSVTSYTESIEENTYIGIAKIARVVSNDLSEYNKHSFIGIGKPNKTKILRIRNVDDFDKFTNTYAINAKDDVFINWEKVSTDYKGIYITMSATNNREDSVVINEKVKNSWLDEYKNYLDKVIIFKQEEVYIWKKEIFKPFKGYVVDEYAVNDDDFVKITDQAHGTKILLIADVKSFDKFTNIYGSIINDKIRIKWPVVKKNYEGLYIDKNVDFYNERYEVTFFNGNRHTSWLKVDNIQSGVVYLFQ